MITHTIPNLNVNFSETAGYCLTAFRQECPVESGWAIETECLAFSQDKIVFKASIKNPVGVVVATGHAQQSHASSIETAENSAIARALANAGFASASPTSQAEEPVRTSRQSSQVNRGNTEQNRSKQEEQSKAERAGKQVQAEVDEARAEKWLRENMDEWLYQRCPFKRSGSRSWLDLANNSGAKISMNGKGEQSPRAYLHAIENWSACSVWSRLKAKIALEWVKYGNLAGRPS